MADRVTAIKREATRVAPSAVALRRDLHAHPELGWTERRSTYRVAEALEAAGISPEVRADGVGLHADVGTKPPVVGFRADLDGLRIQEENSVPYRSQVDGVMHACGHDVHSAIGVGVATAIHRLQPATGVRVFFQPAEEMLPGGAQMLREEGIHEGLRALFAFHVDPSLQPGKLGIKVGPITSASDKLTITLGGPGGHTSRPEQTVDLVSVAAQVALELPARLGKEINGDQSLVLAFGRIIGGTADNVIPSAIELGGTVRVNDTELWTHLPELVEKATRDIVSPLGAEIDIEHRRGSPPVDNDAGVVAAVRGAAVACLGAENVVETHQSMGSEDFSWLLQDVPGAMARLGAALSDRKVDLHSPRFDVDESTIETGIAVAVESLLRLAEQ